MNRKYRSRLNKIFELKQVRAEVENIENVSKIEPSYRILKKNFKDAA